MNIKTDNNLTIKFLNTIKDLINSLKICDNKILEIRKHENQKYIESEWINIVKINMNDNKNLTSNLKKVIKMFKKV